MVNDNHAWVSRKRQYKLTYPRHHGLQSTTSAAKIISLKAHMGSNIKRRRKKRIINKYSKITWQVQGNKPYWRRHRRPSRKYLESKKLKDSGNFLLVIRYYKLVFEVKCMETMPLNLKKKSYYLSLSFRLISVSGNYDISVASCWWGRVHQVTNKDMVRYFVSEFFGSGLYVFSFFYH